MRNSGFKLCLQSLWCLFLQKIELKFPSPWVCAALSDSLTSHKGSWKKCWCVISKSGRKRHWIFLLVSLPLGKLASCHVMRTFRAAVRSTPLHGEDESPIVGTRTPSNSRWGTPANSHLSEPPKRIGSSSLNQVSRWLQPQLTQCLYF
jgi:hypothetical protein